MPINQGTTLSVTLNPLAAPAMVSHISSELERSKPEIPTAVEVNVQGIGMRIVFVTEKSAIQEVLGDYTRFPKGGIASTLTKMMNGDGLTNTIKPHPARARGRALVAEIDRLHALNINSFADILPALFEELPTGDPRLIIHKHFARYINRVFFNDAFDDFGGVLSSIQGELAKLMPYHIRQQRFNLLAIMGSLGIDKSAEQVQREVHKLISKLRAGEDVGVPNLLADLSDLEISGHVQSLLQGMLDTVGNATASLSWLYSHPEVAARISETENYRSLGNMAVSVYTPAPFMLRELAEETLVGNRVYPQGTLMGASLFHAIRQTLGIGYGFTDLDFVEVLKMFENNPLGRESVNIAFGWSSHTHCIGQVPALDMMHHYTRYLSSNHVLHATGNPKYISPLTGYLTGFKLKVS